VGGGVPKDLGLEVFDFALVLLLLELVLFLLPVFVPFGMEQLMRRGHKVSPRIALLTELLLTGVSVLAIGVMGVVSGVVLDRLLLWLRSLENRVGEHPTPVLDVSKGPL
jgi:hypothetical protein